MLHWIELSANGSLCETKKKKKKIKSLPMLLLTLCKQTGRPSFSPTYWRRKSRTGGCFHRAFRPTDWLASVHGTGKYFAYHQRKTLNTNNVTFFFFLKLWTTCKIQSWNNVMEFVRITNQYLIEFKIHSLRWNPSPTLFGCLRNWD